MRDKVRSVLPTNKAGRDTGYMRVHNTLSVCVFNDEGHLRRYA